MNRDSKILVLGGSGLLGGAVLKLLTKRKHQNLLAPPSKELDLMQKKAVDDYFSKHKPDNVFMTAGLVGGIMANMNRQADFLYCNAIMILNVLESVKNFSPKTKILFTGSTCTYPRENPQPIKEDRFMAGKLEETNIGYSIAKIMGVIACQKYSQQYNIQTVCAAPTNLYGIGDRYDPQNGHFLASIIKKFLTAKKNNHKKITFWGSGEPRREALFNEDCADALIYLMENYSSSDLVNIGTNKDYSIKQYVEIIKETTGFKGEIGWDPTKPDGTLLKRTDITKLKKIYPEFNPRTLSQGLNEILENKEEVKRILEEL